MDNTTQKVEQALSVLGVGWNALKVISLGLNRYRVDVDGKYFGVYDTLKNTFVD